MQTTSNNTTFVMVFAQIFAACKWINALTCRSVQTITNNTEQHHVSAGFWFEFLLVKSSVFKGKCFYMFQHRLANNIEQQQVLVGFWRDFFPPLVEKGCELLVLWASFLTMSVTK